MAKILRPSIIIATLLLVAEGATAQSAVDNLRAATDSLRATVDSLRAATNSLRATVDSLRAATDSVRTPKPWWAFNKAHTFGLDPVILQPGAQWARPNDSLDPGEIDPFGNGVAAKVELAGLDLAGYLNDGQLRLGINAGVGVTGYSHPAADRTNAIPDTAATAEPNTAAGPEDPRQSALLLWSLSGFVQFHPYYRINVGVVGALSSDEQLGGKRGDRTAFFVGFSVPTVLNESIRQRD